MSVNREPQDPRAGAINLLQGMIGLHGGETLLIVSEPPGSPVYADEIAPFLAARAREIGAQVRLEVLPVPDGPEHVPPALLEAIAGSHHTLFLNRVGDQLRFAPLPGPGTKTIAYTGDLAALGAPFGWLPTAFLEEVLQRACAAIDTARVATIRCANGTDLRVSLPRAADGPATAPFTVRNFPVMIVPPISGAGAEGRLVLTHALTSTSIHAYEGSTLPLPSPVTLVVEGGRVVGIEGDTAVAARVRTQFERVGALVGGDPWALNSWHTGINPTTFYEGRALDDMVRWDSVSFGSPRFTHFHLCGNAPGDICGQLFDATIAFDDAVLWTGGRFSFLDRAEQVELASRMGIDPDVISRMRDIGV